MRDERRGGHRTNPATRRRLSPPVGPDRRAAHHHRHERGGPVDGRQGPGGPRLVRRRQPARRSCIAGLAELTPSRPTRGGDRGSPWWSTSAAAPSSPSCASRARRAARRGLARRRVLFLDATDEALVRRFESRPPPAPAAGRRPAARRHRPRSGSCSRDLRAERRHRHRHLRAQRARAGRQGPRSRSATTAAPGVRLTLMSFGFKYGIPLDADLVVDVRFLPNPFWVPELRPAHRPGRGGRRLRAGPGGRRGVPRPRTSRCWSRCWPATCARTSATPRSPSAAPAASTARWRMAEELAAGCCGADAGRHHRRAPRPGAGVTGTGAGARRRGGRARRRPRPGRLAVGAAATSPTGSPRSSRSPTTAARPGRLRREFGVLPPGDLRMALAALCDDSEWGQHLARRAAAPLRQRRRRCTTTRSATC